ncbi:MAG: tRNA pseudouridine(38-40) synthase TruA [Bacteroidota bacterium]|nr:tRNA pseudouridine(38-40) synthase TruA [Bacteroidota bacterium]
MPTCVAMIEYDGTNYCGWQRQANGTSIQESLENALATCCRLPKVTVTGSGRTDAGVHARGQIAHFQAPHDHLPVPRKILKSLNGLLPPDIAVLRVARAPDDFHARFDAQARRYHYHVSLQPTALDKSTRLQVRCAPNFDHMNAAARQLIGRHHFGAFCRTQSPTQNRICRVTQAEWIDEGGRGHWHFEITADRFLHGMVRAIVGTLLEIGNGKRAIDSIAAIMASQDRRMAGPAAAPHGLVLEKVIYSAPLFREVT